MNREAFEMNKLYDEIYEFVHWKASVNKDGFVNIGFDQFGRLNCPEAEKSSVCVYKGRKRKSGKEKVISKIYAPDGKVHYTQTEHIIDNFDAIAAIDTNRFTYNGRNLAIAASYFCNDVKSILKGPVVAEPLPFFIIENTFPGLNPEAIAWDMFFKYTLPILNLNKKNKLALVSDSELGKHADINSRKMPYFGDSYLPKNISLLYAFEKGSDPQNLMIRSCDKNSRILFKQIETGELKLPNMLQGKTVNFSGCAYVNIEFSQYKITA